RHGHLAQYAARDVDGHVAELRGRRLRQRKQHDHADERDHDRRGQPLIHHVIPEHPGRVLRQERSAMLCDVHSPTASRKCCSRTECAGRMLLTSTPRASSCAMPAFSVARSMAARSYSPSPRGSASLNTARTAASLPSTWMRYGITAAPLGAAPRGATTRCNLPPSMIAP